MALLDIQIDLFQFKRLLENMDPEQTGLTREQLAGRLLYYIGRYKNTPDVTSQQAAALLAHAAEGFALLLEQQPEGLPDKLLETTAAAHIRANGLDAILDRPFATLTPVDRLYLLYLECYCGVLARDPETAGEHGIYIEKVQRTVGNIREADRVYGKDLPTRKRLLMAFKGPHGGAFQYGAAERRELLSGKGRLSLTVIDCSENNRALLKKLNIENKPVGNGLGYTSKLGVYDNLAVDETPEHESYLSRHKMQYAINNKGYLLDGRERNMLLKFTYRDLISLWPSVRYFIVNTYLRMDEDEETYRERRDFCEEIDFEGVYFPLEDAVRL